jgi:hypothetical protein
MTGPLADALEAPGTDGTGPAGADELAAAAQVPLPALVTVTQAFSARLPSQRILDLMARAEPDIAFGDLAATQPFRIVAFRALLRDFPGRDPTSLWLHAYDVEVEVADINPTNRPSPTPAPGSATTGD